MKTLTKVLKTMTSSSGAGPMKALALGMFLVGLLFLASCANLIDATHRSDIATVKALLEKGADGNARDKWGRTALIVATRTWHSRNGRAEPELEIVKLLIEKGADVNAKDNLGETALMAASSEGNTEIAELLIEKGADVNARSISGDTALIVAFAHGRTETAKLLLAKGAAMDFEKMTHIAHRGEMTHNGYGRKQTYTIDARMRGSMLMTAVSINRLNQVAKVLLDRLCEKHII